MRKKVATQLPKLRTRVRFPTPAPGLVSLQRLRNTLQIFNLMFAIVFLSFPLVAEFHCRSTVVSALTRQYVAGPAEARFVGLRYF